MKYVNLETIGGDGPELRNLQDGFKEYLLCEWCEGRFNKWETYCAPMFFAASTPFVKPPKNYPCFWIDKAEYKPFKLLTLSIIWRMAVSKHVFYSHFVLPPKQERLLQTMLLANDPGDPLFYPCDFTVIADTQTGNALKGMFSQPLKIAKPPNGSTGYGFILAGVHWHVFTEVREDVRRISKYFMQRNGTCLIRVGTINDFSYLEPLWEYERNGRVFPPSSFRNPITIE